jgi:hypothetical protein
LLDAPPIVICLNAAVYECLQVFEHRQHENAQRRHTLLPVNNIEDSVVRRLQHEIAHVMSRLTTRCHRAKDVLPEVVPLIFFPTVIALKTRHTVGQAITQQLAEGLIGGIEIDGRHKASPAGYAILHLVE